MTNDLISKSAALEELEKHRNMWDKNLTGDMYHFTEVRQIINETPSPWIPVSERLPDDLEPVNITWINHEPEPYYKEIKDKPFTATGVLFKGQWYWWSTLCTDILAEYQHNHYDIIDEDIEIIAWQPLPEPYKETENE